MLRGATQCDTTTTEGRSQASFKEGRRCRLIKNDDDYNSNDEKVSPELTCANVVVRAIAAGNCLCSSQNSGKGSLELPKCIWD